MQKSSQTMDRGSWVHTVLGDQNFQAQKGFFAWWYRHTSPPDPGSGASFQARDRVRRSRIAAACMLFLATILLFVGLIAYFGPNKQIANVLYSLYPMIACCLFLNRRGYVSAVGILLTLGLVGGMCLTLFTTAAGPGLSPNDIQILYLLFFAELFVAAILPINAVFFVAAINVVISIYMLDFAHHTPALDTLLTTGAFSILFRVMQIHVIVPCVLWILVSNSHMAIMRADRAEELARLQHDLRHMAEQAALKNVALERSIDLITDTHTRFANGDLGARVPMQGNGENTFVLWQVGGQLNNLLVRYQKLRQELQQREQYDQAFRSLMDRDPALRASVNFEIQRQHSL